MKNFFTKWGLFVLIFLTTDAVFAQNLDSLKARYNGLAPYVPSGILYDRNPINSIWYGSMYNSSYYDGTVDSICTKAAFAELHMLKYHESFDSSIMLFQPENLDDLINQALYEQDVSSWTVSQFMNSQPINHVVLGFMDLDYHALSIMAYDSAWSRSDSNGDYYLQLSPFAIHDTLFLDTINFSIHPDSIILMDTIIYPDSLFILNNAFKQYRLLALSALTETVYASDSTSPSIWFHLGDSLFITNKSAVSYEIDWDDGQGFVAFDPTLRKYNITYGSYGLKNIIVRTENEEQSDLHPDLYIRTQFRIARSISFDGSEAFPLAFSGDTCARDLSAGVGSGIVTWRFAENRTAFYKPFIMVEGFDQGAPNSPETNLVTTNNPVGFGQLNWNSLTSGYIPGMPGLDKFPELLDSISNEGYDIILVDFRTSRATIQKNSNALINVIDYINLQLRNNDSPEEIVVFGASMGGIISRYAIRQMELGGCCHNVRLYGTFSSPHQGANIALGLQHFVKSLGDENEFNLFEIGNSAKALYNFVLNSPAARQLLVYHADPSAATERTDFQNELDSMGQPQYCRRVTLTDGSQTSVGQMDNATFMLNNQKLIEIDVKIWFPRTVKRDGQDSRIETLKDIRDGKSVSIPPGNWTMFNAEAFAIGANTMGNLQVFLQNGDLPKNNYEAYLEALNYFEKQALRAQLYKKYWYVPIYNRFLLARAGFLMLRVPNRMDNFHALNEARNGLSPYRYSTMATLPYDNCPGDYVETQRAITLISRNYVQSNFPHHTFIPTVSALDIDTSDLIIHVKSNFELNENITPFEDYWANYNESATPQSNNRDHVFVDAENIVWLTDKLQQTHPKFLSQQGSNALDTYYNFAGIHPPNPQERILAPDLFLPAVTVESGATLFVNKYDDITYQNAGLGLPTEYSNFQLYTSQASCELPHVLVENEAVFMVGDTNYTTEAPYDNNKAEVYFRFGSILELKPGSVLRINDNSKLVIEAGAELILHDENSIMLDGPNAVLEIRGKVSMLNSAALQTSGTGYIRFAQPLVQTNPTDYWALAGENRISLVGTGKGHKKAEVVHMLVLDSSLHELEILNCKVDMRPDASIHLKGKATIDSALFISSATNYDRVAVYGQANLTIKNSEFRRGDAGLIGYLTSISHPLKVENCDFKQCLVGLQVINKNLELKNSRLDSNSTGLIISNASADCEVQNSQFNYNTYAGLVYLGQTNANLLLRTCQLKYNHIGLEIGEFTKATLSCNQITNNSYIGIFAGNSYVNMGDYAANQLTDNYIAMDLVGTHIRLAGGRNNFAGSGYYLTGALHPNAVVVAATGDSVIDVQHNRMPASEDVVPIDLVTMSANEIGLLNWAPLSVTQTACPMTTNPTYVDWVLAQPNVSIVANTSNMNDDLPLVVADALSKMTSDFELNPNEDAMAVEYFGEIFSDVRSGYAYIDNQYAETNQLTAMTEEETLVMKLAVDMSLKALSNAYRYEFLEPNRAVAQSEIPTEIQVLVDELDNLTDNYYTQAVDEAGNWFYYKLAKAQAYRTGEYYDYALAVLGDISSENETINDVKAYWECVCELEESYILEQISVEQYHEDMQACVKNAPALRRAAPGPGIRVPNPNEWQLPYSRLYPNPSSGSSTIWFSANERGYIYQVSNLNGQRMFQAEVPAGLSTVELQAGNLGPGIYLIQITDGVHPPQLLKWVLME